MYKPWYARRDRVILWQLVHVTYSTLTNHTRTLTSYCTLLIHWATINELLLKCQHHQWHVYSIVYQYKWYSEYLPYYVYLISHKKKAKRTKYAKPYLGWEMVLHRQTLPCMLINLQTDEHTTSTLRSKVVPQLVECRKSIFTVFCFKSLIESTEQYDTPSASAFTTNAHK